MKGEQALIQPDKQYLRDLDAAFRERGNACLRALRAMDKEDDVGDALAAFNKAAEHIDERMHAALQRAQDGLASRHTPPGTRREPDFSDGYDSGEHDTEAEVLAIAPEFVTGQEKDEPAEDDPW